MGGLATYDANDRPVLFEQEGGVTVIHCEYDYRGRRWEKKVVVNGEVTRHARYIYRGYLQLGEVDLLNQVELVRKYVWDPTEPVATKLLSGDFVLEGRDTPVTVYYAHDRQKNVTAFFNEARERRGWYEYMPFGALRMVQEEMGWDNAFRFSNEYMDDETGLIYYNYRHYNPVDGRWTERDPIQEYGGYNLYRFLNNNINKIDYLGLSPADKCSPKGSMRKEKIKSDLIISGRKPGEFETMKLGAEIISAALSVPKTTSMLTPKSVFKLPKSMGNVSNVMNEYLKKLSDVYVYVEISVDCCQCEEYGFFSKKTRLGWINRKMGEKSEAFKLSDGDQKVANVIAELTGKIRENICNEE